MRWKKSARSSAARATFVPTACGRSATCSSSASLSAAAPRRSRKTSSAKSASACRANRSRGLVQFRVDSAAAYRTARANLYLSPFCNVGKSKMDFGLSDDQTMFQQSLRGFLGERVPTERVRTVMESASGHDAALVQQLAEQGVTGILIP